MAYDVFISYSRKDTGTAETVTNALTAAGLSVFIDKEGIDGGANFPEVLANTIDSSGVFLLLASKNAYSSKFTRAEILYAFNHKRSGCIIPYVLDDSKMPTDLEFLLGNVNWLYSSSCPVESLPEAVKKALANPGSGTLAGRKVRRSWLPAVALGVLAVTVALLTVFSLKQRSAKKAALADHAAYEALFSRADSLVQAADRIGRGGHAITAAAAQISLLQQACGTLSESDSIRNIYLGGEHLAMFNKDAASLKATIGSKLDSIHTAWAGFAEESYRLYKSIGSRSEAANALECIDIALSVKENPALTEIKQILENQ